MGGLYMSLAAGIWGGVFAVSKMILGIVQPMELIFLRYLVALVTLAMMTVVSKKSWKIRWRHFPRIAVVGTIGYAFSIWAQFMGTKLSTAQMGAMITSATPAFMVVFSRFFLHEKITVRKGFSVGLATVGVLMIIGVGSLRPAYELGGAILVVAAITWALMSVLVKRVPQEYSQITVTMYALLVATVIMSPFAVSQLAHTSLALWLNPGFWGGLLYMGIVSTAGAFFLWNKGLQLLDASTGGLFFFVQPLVGTFLGWLILGENVGLPFWIGAALILFSVVLVLRNA